MALEGTQFSLINTPPSLDTFAKAVSRRGRAAFAKMTTAVLLEVGLHNPLAAASGRQGESEWALAQQACRRVGLPLHPRHNHNRVIGWLEVREIRGRVRRKGHRAHELRLWTSLLDPAAAPALELAARLCESVGTRAVFSRTETTAAPHGGAPASHRRDGAQEIVALVLASAVLATARARAATGTIPPLRIGVGQLLDIVRGMWLILGPFDGIFTDPQKTRGVRRGRALMRRSLTAPRRPRPCPRAVRQPVTRWPRLMKPASIEQPWTLQLV